MNGLPYYKAYPRDFIEGTIGMPFELKGAYRLVLDLIYMQGGKLSDDPRYISGLLGCSIRAWNGYRAKLIEMGKLTAENGIISNFRASLEMDNLKMMQEKQRQNGLQPKKTNKIAEATASPLLNQPEPEPEPELNIEDLFGSTEPQINAREVVEDRFEEFWIAYPPGRKTAKADVRVLFNRIVSGKHKKHPKTDAGEIIAAAKRFASTAPDPQYTAAPMRWLNEARWDLFPAPAPSVPVKRWNVGGEIIR